MRLAANNFRRQTFSLDERTTDAMRHTQPMCSSLEKLTFPIEFVDGVCYFCHFTSGPAWPDALSIIAHSKWYRFSANCLVNFATELCSVCVRQLFMRWAGKGSSSNVFVWNSLAVHLAQHMGPTWLLKPPLSNTTIIFGVCSFCTNNAANFCENAFIIGSYISKPLQLMMFTACPRWIASSLSFADYSQFQRTYHGSRWLIERDYYYLDAFKAFEAFERLLGWVR